LTIKQKRRAAKALIGFYGVNVHLIEMRGAEEK